MPEPPTRLRREIGLPGAVLLGLGSILGTGVFVSLGLAVELAGPAALAAVVLAGFLATANGLSSAQLAARHPVSGGTYEYGYRYLSPALGFTAGWMFLAAKSASAATAALGVASYLLHVIEPGAFGALPRVLLAEGVVVVLVVIAAGGLRRSNRANAAILAVAFGSLAVFLLAALPAALSGGVERFRPFVAPAPGHGSIASILAATALVFVAYTGYGRIATLGEEVRDPRRTIPRAIALTLAVSALVYLAVAAVGVGSVGAEAFAGATLDQGAPLAVVARGLLAPGAGRTVAAILTAGAVAAMVGVTLNLILGLSRMMLAMGRRGDLPASLGRLDAAGTTPRAAVLASGVLIAALTALGDLEITWSFSAFTVLVYYALANLSALRLKKEESLFPRWIAIAGLLGCLSLAFWVDRGVWLAGLGILAAGLVWFGWVSRRRSE